MRFLILLGTILAVGIWLHFSLKRDRRLAEEARAREPEPAPPQIEESPEAPLVPDTPLETELRDAVAAFLEARGDVAEDGRDTRAAIALLAEKTSKLETRVRADDAFARRVHKPVKRLLLALYSVVQRAARATHRSPSPERDAVIAASTDALTRAAEQMGRVTERADEVAMRKLEADLEVLEERLQETA